MWRIASVFLCSLLGLAGAAHAQTCKPPGSLDHVSAIRGTVTLAGNGGNCDIVAVLAAGNDATGGAFAWYSLPQPNPHWRLSFRVDTSQLGEQRTPLDSLTILSATTRKPYPIANGVADLLRVQAFPTGGATVPTLWAVSACGSQPSLVCSKKLADTLADGDLLRFELTVGAGSQGALRWWINSDFSNEPTGAMENLDNAAWHGVQTVALGAFGPSGQIAQNGTTLRFYEIESADDTLFWYGFEY